MIDITSLFTEHNIDFRTSGKNVTSGWVEINCPFCPDPSYHMGINLSSCLYHCWICGARGGPERLLKELLDISYSSAKKLIQEFDINRTEEIEEKEEVEEIKYPKGIFNKLPSAHREYLIKRKFDPDLLMKKYKLKACLHTGDDFAYRLIIPIIIDNQVVSYTGRDISGKQKTKYKHLSNDKSIIQVKNCLYNIDTVKDKVLIVEGPMDVWRIGDGCVALFGTEHTLHQLNTLFGKNLKEAYVMFDAETHTIRKAHRLANILSTFVPKVDVLELDGEGALDPAELDENDVLKLRGDLKL